jgi:hypothetical protein
MTTTPNRYDEVFYRNLLKKHPSSVPSIHIAGSLFADPNRLKIHLGLPHRTYMIAY